VQVHAGTLDPATLRFTAESTRQLDPTDHFYAPNNLLAPDGRRILWGDGSRASPIRAGGTGA
jgi:hypothetical protein